MRKKRTGGSAKIWHSDGKPPLEIARTESGARVVEQMLAKIDWGAAA
jgi:Protein of unknown function (DUF2384).